VEFLNNAAAWRLKLGEARRLTVKGGFAALAASGHRALPGDLATRLADRFTTFREEEMFVFAGAHEAIDRLRALGVKLALVTNTAAHMQRVKVERFELTHRIDYILIEGEHGFWQARGARLRDLDGRAWRGLTCGIADQARPHHPLADRTSAPQDLKAR
jgi:phosphoglycolate phosphatase-like HAD superfamily hydrolase